MAVTTQKVGNLLGFAGLVGLPILIAFAIYMEFQRKQPADMKKWVRIPSLQDDGQEK